MFCDVNFTYRLYHDCVRTLKRSLSGKLVIVKLLSDFGFARNSSEHTCILASFSCDACLVVRVPTTLPVSCTVNVVVLPGDRFLLVY